MNKKNIIPIVVLSVIVTFGISISLQSLIAAWVAPGETPPGGNVAAPINIGSTNQSKLGGLTIKGKTKTEGGLVIQTSATTPAGAEHGSMWIVP